MKEIVKLSARGSISTDMDNTIILNGRNFGNTLGRLLSGQYIENAVVNITIFDGGAEEKEAPTCPTA